MPDSVTNIEDYAFSGCRSLTEVYFQSNAPNADCTVFEGDNVTVYYLPGTTGWDGTFMGCPAVLLPWTYTTDHGAITITGNIGVAGVATITNRIDGLPVRLEYGSPVRFVPTNTTPLFVTVTPADQFVFTKT